jgi:hypothetical protein
MFVVAWRAMCAIARSFSLSFLCPFAWLDCTVADELSLFGDLTERRPLILPDYIIDIPHACIGD